MKQEQMENDLIRRKDLAESIQQLDIYPVCIRRAIERAPAVDAELVKHGRWVCDENYEYWADKYICSECNHHALTDGDYRHKLSNYCPNCGAKMDLEDE